MSELLAELARLADAGALEPIDVELARALSRLALSGAREVALAACVASAQVGAGNACADLRAWAGEPLVDFPDVRAIAPRLPRYEAWRAALLASGVATDDPARLAPLVLDARGRLYLHRYWSYEREVAAELRRRAALDAVGDPAADARLAARLAVVFRDEGETPGGAPATRAAASRSGALSSAAHASPAPATAPAGGGPAPAAAAHADPPTSAPATADDQRVAAALALVRPLAVISGGPGTGKTTTVVRILALLVEQAVAERGAAAAERFAVRLAAPTGKAAARMQEAVRAAKARLADRFDQAVLARVPDGASTVHRLLGTRPGRTSFRHDRGDPLPLDVLVIDEASMIDLALMARLLRALPPAAKLVLVGDKDQLASVEAGAVLGDVCGGPPAYSPPLRERLTALCGAPPAESRAASRAAGAPASPLRDSIALLRRSYRFGPTSGIGELARCVNEGRGDDALELLAGGRHADVTWREIASPEDLRDALRATAGPGFAPMLERSRAGAPAEEVFAAFNRFRVLCAVRRGEFGVDRLNERIAALLREQALVEGRGDWYAGRPVMIAQNDYGLRLWNGDVGIALADDAGRLRVHFEAGDGHAVAYPPVRLPHHEPVFAMTIHKSQGSEFDRVVVVLPPERSRSLGRELLYTGITRAREGLEIWASRESVLEATRRPLARAGGLRDALWAE